MNYTVKTEAQLLNFLLEDGPKLTRTKAKSLLKYGQISVNGKTIKAFDYKLRPGSSVGVGHSTKHIASAQKRLDIIFENEELIVINKPDGLLSVPTEGIDSESAYDLVTNYLKARDSKQRAHIVHRLDQYTSGILLFSKSKELKVALQENWNETVTARKYYAVVEGAVEPKRDQISSYLRNDEGFYVRSSDKARGDAKLAITQYEVLREIEGFTLLDVSLRTGRKNQIRVHLSEREHPVVGDKKYGSKSNPLRRLGLHAYRLELVHPVSGETLSFHSKMPKSFKRLFAEAVETQ